MWHTWRLAKLIDLLDFLVLPLMKITNKKSLQLFLVCHLGRQWGISSQKSKVTPSGYKIAPPTNTSYDVACVTTTHSCTMMQFMRLVGLT